MQTSIETTEVDELEWISSPSTNDVFEFLADETEDIYSLMDGMPVTHE